MTTEKKQKVEREIQKSQKSEALQPKTPVVQTTRNPEHGGPKGLEPTRYGDWERKGRCIDF